MSRRRNRNQKRSRRSGIDKRIEAPKNDAVETDASEEQFAKTEQQDIETADVERPEREPEPAPTPEEEVEVKTADESSEEDNDAIAEEEPSLESEDHEVPEPEMPSEPKLSLKLKNEAEISSKPPMPSLDETSVYSGDILRQVREHKGITLRTISNITRIGVPSLMAVEEERYEDLPNARIYVLGFVRCLSQEIGLDREVAGKSYIERWQNWWDGRSEEDRRSYR